MGQKLATGPKVAAKPAAALVEAVLEQAPHVEVAAEIKKEADASSIQKAHQAVLDAIDVREVARAALCAVETEFPEPVTAWLLAYNADVAAKEAVKQAMAVAAALTPNEKKRTYVQDARGKYAWSRRVLKLVDTERLVDLHPRMIYTRPEIFVVKPSNLDRMVDEGVLSGPERAEVIFEAAGPVVRYVPAYKKGAKDIGGDGEDDTDGGY